MATMFLRQRARSILCKSLGAHIRPAGLSEIIALERSGGCRTFLSECPQVGGSRIGSFSRSSSLDCLVRLGNPAGRSRGFCDGASAGDYTQQVDEINLKFAVAREEIESAMESKDTVYFNEEADCAREAVKEVLELFDDLLSKLPEKEKATLRRSMGLKLEQLKAELAQLDE